MYEELIAALNAADKRPCSDLECPGSGECPTVGCLFREAADAIEQLSTYSDFYEELTGKGIKTIRELLDKFPKWIPVTERLPEKNGKYLTAFKDGCVTDNFFMAPTGEKFKEAHPNGKWYWNETDRGGITHWMPLPTPPKEETE